jgi:transposase
VEEKGFAGGESTVRHYVRRIRSKPADAFVPLEYDPGEAMQIDWGEATGCYAVTPSLFAQLRNLRLLFQVVLYYQHNT